MEKKLKGRENPFSPTFPVNPKYFVNRTEIINSFEKAFERSVKIKLPVPDNIAILGDWGIGKSSVLRKFESMSLEESKDRRMFSAIVELIPASCNSFPSLSDRIIDDINNHGFL